MSGSVLRWEEVEARGREALDEEERRSDHPEGEPLNFLDLECLALEARFVGDEVEGLREGVEVTRP